MGTAPLGSQSPWTAMTKYHSLGDLTTNTYLSEFWRLEIPRPGCQQIRLTGEGPSWFVDGYLLIMYSRAFP